MKIYISAQAESLHSIEMRMTDHLDEIEMNVIKLLLGPDVLTRNHWQHEIFTQLHSVKMIKGKNKYPSADKIFSWLYTNQIPDMQEPRKFRKMVQSILYTEKELSAPADMRKLQSEVISILKQYYKWLSEQLATDGFVSQQDIYAKLDELL